MTTPPHPLADSRQANAVAARASRRRGGGIASVVGTRPEAIKMAPVLRAIAERGLFDQQLLLTGQHRELTTRFDFLPDDAIVDLGIDPRNDTLEGLTERIRRALCGRFVAAPPNLVLVQGDTISALAGALAATECGIPLGHVEAGLRSFDLQQPFPEEGNRIAIDALSDLLFAPTQTAADNLAAEPRVTGDIHVTGNSGIDALFEAGGIGAVPSKTGSRKTILVTCHRKENQGAGLVRVCATLKRLVAELPVAIVFPLHPNRHVRAEVEELLAGTPHISLLPPLGHAEMIAQIIRSWLLLTDSGGLQEEGPALGRPVLVLREVTERGEGGDSLGLVGTDPDRICAAVGALLHDAVAYARMARPSLPFGDGKAGPRIAAAIEGWLFEEPAAAL